MVNAARGVTRSRSRASPRARRGGDRTRGRGSVAGETRTPRGARGIARARARCVSPPDSGDFGSSLERPGTAVPVVMAGSCVDVETSASAPARRPRRDDEPKRIFAIRKRDTPSTSFSSQRWWTTAPTYQVGSHPPHHVVCCVIPGLLPRRRVRPRTRNGPDGESRSTPQTMTAKTLPGAARRALCHTLLPSPDISDTDRLLERFEQRVGQTLLQHLDCLGQRSQPREHALSLLLGAHVLASILGWPTSTIATCSNRPRASLASRRVSVRLRRRTAASLLRTRPASSHTGDGGEARRGAALSRSVPKAPSMWRACPR